MLVLERYGREHFQALGRLGGRPTVEEVNADNREWDSKKWRRFMRGLES